MSKMHTSAAVLLLEKFLKDQPDGKLFTFDELNKAAERDVKTDRFIIASVMRILTRHHDRVLRSVRGIGYEIVKQEEVVDVSQAFRKSAKNKIVRAYDVTSTIDVSKLSQADLAKYLKEQAKVGTLLTVCRVIDSRKLLKKGADQVSVPTEGSVMALLFNRNSETETDAS